MSEIVIAHLLQLKDATLRREIKDKHEGVAFLARVTLLDELIASIQKLTSGDTFYKIQVCEGEPVPDTGDRTCWADDVYEGEDNLLHDLHAVREQLEVQRNWAQSDDNKLHYRAIECRVLPL